MAGMKLLTELAFKNAKPRHKVYYLNDGGGLRLRCRPDGSKVWLFRFRVHGKESCLGLGVYPTISLIDARILTKEHMKTVSEGRNPTVVKKINKAKHVAQQAATFGTLAAEWIEHNLKIQKINNKPRWSAHHLERNAGLLRRYLLPQLAQLPITSIDEDFLFAVLKPLYDKGTQDSARRARAVAAQIFSYARATHRCTLNPARDMADKDYFQKPEVKHFTAIAQEAVPSLVAELNKTGTEQRLEPRTACGLLVALYTGLRDHSIRGATWAEIDFTKNLWVVPGERMKSGRAHKLPLPTQAITALQMLHPLTYRSPESFIFASNTKTGYMAENTLRLALHRLGHKVTVHGMRSLITDVLNENGFNADAIEKHLDHQEKNGVRRAYLRSEFMEERKRMMQWFADWCDQGEGLLRSNNVVSLQARR